MSQKSSDKQSPQVVPLALTSENAVNGVDNADAGHLERDVESRKQCSGHCLSPGRELTGKKTTGVPGD